MSEQTAKIEKVRENIKSYPNKNPQSSAKNPTVYVHGIVVQGDATEWEYHSFKSTCDVFTAGQEATFTTEVKQNGQYTNHKIVPSRVEKKSFTPGGGGNKFNPEFEEKRQRMIIAQSSVSSAVAFYGETSGKTEEKTLEFANKIYEWVINKAK